VLRLTAIKSNNIDLGECKGGDWTEAEAKPFLVSEGDFLVSRGNGSKDLVARGGLVSATPMKVAFPDTMIRIRFRPDVMSARYLVRVWESPVVRDQIMASVRTTAGIYKVNQQALERLQIPVPPLGEQRRIADTLDRMDNLRVKRREAIVLTDRLAQSIFFDMFGDPVSNPRRWPRKSIRQLGRVTTGNTPPRSDERNFGDVIEWIKSDNITSGNEYVTRASEGLSLQGMSRARTVGPGALLVTCIAGSPASIGNAALTDRRVAFNQQINAFEAESRDSHFMYMQLTLAKRLIQEKSTGGMKGLVSKSSFESILLVDPPLTLQRDFGVRCRAIEQQKRRHRSYLAELDALIASVQHRAFRGELFADSSPAAALSDR
jgi:type I restriction enzyme S subunit